MPGPTVSKNLVVNIRGIEMLEDAAAWASATSDYISEHFAANANADAVSVSIAVVSQKSSNEALNELINVRRALRWPRLPLPWNYRDGGGDEGRRLQSKSVEVAYDQTSTWTTPDPAKYDAVYIATDGFNGRDEIGNYRKTLEGLSPYYKAVTSVGSVRVDPPPEGIPIDGEKYGIFAPEPPTFLDKLFGEGMGKPVQIVSFAAICLGGLAVVVLSALGVRRRRRNKRRKLEEDSDSVRARDMDGDSISMADLEEGRSGDGSEEGKKGGIFKRLKSGRGAKDDKKDKDEEKKKKEKEKRKGKKSKKGKDDSDDSSSSDEDGGRSKKTKKEKKMDKGKEKSSKKKKKKLRGVRGDSDDSSSDDDEDGKRGTKGGDDEKKTDKGKKKKMDKGKEKSSKKKNNKSGRGTGDSDDSSSNDEEDGKRGTKGSDDEKKTDKGKKKKMGKGKEKSSKKKNNKSRRERGDSDDSSSDDDEDGKRGSKGSDDEKGSRRGGTKNRGKGKRRDEKVDKEKKSKRKSEKYKRGGSDSDDSSSESGSDVEEKGSRRGGHKSRSDRKGKENKKKNSKTGNEGRKSRREMGDSYELFTDGEEDGDNSRSGRSFKDSLSHGGGGQERPRHRKSSRGEDAKRRPRQGTSSRHRRRYRDGRSASSHNLQYDGSRSESLREGAQRGKERAHSQSAHSQSDNELRYGPPDEVLSPRRLNTLGDYWKANEGPGPRTTLKNEPHHWGGPSTVQTTSLTRTTSRIDVDSMLHGIPEAAEPHPRRAMGPSPSTSVTRSALVIAPKGKLGLVMDAAPDGTTCVCEVKKQSPIFGKLKPEDKIIAIDNEDVQTMNAAGISKLLAQKCQQPERRITVLREVAVRALTWRDSDMDVDDHLDDASAMNNSIMSAMF